MLTADDTPTIRFALTRRLEKEPGVDIFDLKFQKYRIGDEYVDENGLTLMTMAPFIRVGLVATLGKTIVTRSRFDLPVPFELSHLHNEIDEIAEQYKAARKEYFGRGGSFLIQPDRQLRGSGLRGHWRKYG